MKSRKPLIVSRGSTEAVSANVDTLCRQLDKMLQQTNKHFDSFACDLLFREVLLNSIEHGCGDIKNANIEYKISVFENHLLVTVKDPGSGFNWKSWLKRPYDPDKSSGRGLMIIRFYAQKFRFNRAGNCISFKRKFY